MNFIGLVRHVLGLRDNTVVPAVCFNSCNNAYLEAQRVGKSPALCAVNSTFQLYYASCTKCITANSNSTVQSLQSYIDPQFGSIITFCTASIATNSTSSPEQQSLASSLASQASYFSSVLSQASSLGYLKPSTTTQLLIVTQTPNNTVTSAQTSSPQQTSLPIVPTRPTNKAWIAGAVIAPLLLLAAILFAAYYIWRRKRRTMTGGQEVGGDEKEGEWVDGVHKAQLHGDSIPRHELDGDQTREERAVSELPALEVVGSELDAKRLDRIRRKPLNQPPATS